MDNIVRGGAIIHKPDASELHWVCSRGLNYNEDNYKVQSHAFGVAAGSADIFPCIPAISEASLLQLCSIV